jgi:hypothetical protein
MRMTYCNCFNPCTPSGTGSLWDENDGHRLTVAIACAFTWFGYITSMLSAYYQYVASMSSVGYQYVISMLSVCYQYVISMLSVCYQYVISMLSVYYQCGMRMMGTASQSLLPAPSRGLGHFYPHFK